VLRNRPPLGAKVVKPLVIDVQTVP
jgi:hypothetical protein